MINFRPCKQINNYLQSSAKQNEISLISFSLTPPPTHTHTCKEKNEKEIKEKHHK